MPEWLLPILTQSGLGITAAVFIKLYLSERKTANAQLQTHNSALDAVRKVHYEQLDGVRAEQIAREREVAKTLDEYGKSVVEAVEQRELLLAVRRINRRVEVERNDLRFPVTTRESSDDERLELAPHLDQFAWRGRILESRDRRLRCQVRISFGVTPDRQLQHRVARQRVRVDAVLIPERDRVRALSDEVIVRERHLALMPPIVQRFEQRSRQADSLAQLRQ